MTKYLVTKEIEIEQCDFECEEFGPFDDEKEAVQLAEKIYAELSEFEKEYYEVAAWRYSGANLDMEDWETIEEGETVVYYPSIATADYEDEFESDYRTRSFSEENTIHYCLSAARDKLRLWISDDTDNFVDREYTGAINDPMLALEDWYKKYGQIAEEDWREYFPQSTRKMYLDSIANLGYSDEEAEEILSYLPMTLADSIDAGVSEMIELWKAKAERIVPYRIPSWKKKLLKGQEDTWAEPIMNQ